MARLAAVALVALAACAPAGGQADGAAPGAATYHVDFAGGDDMRDGRTPATAWKRAPGDPDASGRAASARLRPGDRVLFRAGVPYRGTIRLTASGTADAPISYSGLGFGEGRGIIDGSDPATAVRACRDAADCLGAPNWQQLWRVEHAAGTERVVLFGATGMYDAATVPALPEPFFGSDRRNFAQIPVSELANLKAGRLRDPSLLTAARAGGNRLELALWVRPNIVRRTPVLGVEANHLRFDPEGFVFYENRPSAAALGGSVAALVAPGLFIEAEPGVALVWPRTGEKLDELSVGSGRGGFLLTRHSHIVIEGLDFRRFAGARGATREGVAIHALSPVASHLTIRDNRFGPAFRDHGTGMVHLYGARHVRFERNRMEDVFGHGLRAGGGRPGDLLIADNLFRRVGSTAIGLLGVDGAIVRRNILADIRGVHGNGITLYLSNRDIRVEENCVHSSTRPLTFHGDKDAETANRIRIAGNILLSSGTGQAAINSWGRFTRDVVIEDNLIAGPKNGLLLNISDIGVVVRGNDTTGIARADRGSGWTVEGNRTDLDHGAAVRSMRLSDTRCEVAAGRRTRIVERTPGSAG